MNAPSWRQNHDQTSSTEADGASPSLRRNQSSLSSPSRTTSEEALNLKVAQSEALGEAPRSAPLYQYHHGEPCDVFRNTSAPLVPLVKTTATTSAPLVPLVKTTTTTSKTAPASLVPLIKTTTTPSLKKFDRKVKKRAYSSALYYSECFLNGITPQEADKAAQQTRGQYQKWWVRATAHDQSTTTAADSGGPPTTDASYSKRKHGGVVSDDGSASTCSGASSKRRRRNRQGEVRDLIDELPRVRRRSLSSTSTCSSALIPPDQGTRDDRHATEPQHFAIETIPDLSRVTWSEIEDVRDTFIAELVANGGDPSTPTAKQSMDMLESFYASSGSADFFPSAGGSAGLFPSAGNRDISCSPPSSCELEGTWLTLTKPTYTGSPGLNSSQDPVYTLGRMSFDMFRPTSLRCSIQGTFNTVHRVEKQDIIGPGGDVSNILSIPRSLRKEIQQSLEDGSAELSTYNIVVAFTIEPGQTITRRGGKETTNVRRPIRGILTNYGYAVPDPNVPDRYSIWFTGGSIEVNDEEHDMDAWRSVFDEAPNRDMMEYARVLAAKVLLGAEIADTMSPNGTMTYALRRPIGGHGSAYCDVLYLDHKMRIMRGHHGSVYCFVKVPDDVDGESKILPR